MSDDVLDQLLVATEGQFTGSIEDLCNKAATAIENLRTWHAEFVEAFDEGAIRDEHQRDEINALRVVVEALMNGPLHGSPRERRDRMQGPEWVPIHDALDALGE
jgi:hypothetical protein